MKVTTDGTLIDFARRPGRLIEVIGDSITCGYGVLGTNGDADCFPTESHWDTYGAIAARALGAEVSTIAGRAAASFATTPATPPGRCRCSTRRGDEHRHPGVGLSRRAAGGRHQPRHQRHQQRQGRSRHGVSRHLPTLLGDAPRLLPAHVHRLHHRAAAERRRPRTISGHIKAAVDARNAAGDSKVEFFNQIPAQTSDKYACQYHPNVAENQMMADLLVTELKAKLGW